MQNDDLDKLRDCKIELFDGIGQLLSNIGLGHLQVAGLELEPTSLKNSGNIRGNEKSRNVENLERFRCEDGYVSERVLRIDPRTGRGYYIYICVPE